MKLVLAALLILCPAMACVAQPAGLYEAGWGNASPTLIDLMVMTALEERGVEPALRCSDAVFVRRAYLDVIGTLPTAAETREFLDSTAPGKREALIEALLERPEFAEYWALHWCDVLRVKAEFPINLWPNGVQAYHRWVRDALANNMPYDGFARALLTSSGSNFRVPPVNFYRAIQGKEPSTIASAVTLTFMGTRLEGWPRQRQEQLTAFFSRVTFKGTAEWKEEIVCLDPSPVEAMDMVLPDGKTIRVAPDADPRTVFADWLTAPGNPWFARAAVNRIWAWLLGGSCPSGAMSRTTPSGCTC
jgi:hypothetical protein